MLPRHLRRERRKHSRREDTLYLGHEIASIAWEAEAAIASERAQVIAREPPLKDLDPLRSFALQLLRDAGSLPREVAVAVLSEVLECHQEMTLALWNELQQEGFVKIVLEGACPAPWIIGTRKAYLLFAGLESDVPLL